MLEQMTKGRLAGLAGSFVLGLAAGSPGYAAVVVGNEQGWELSFDGNINAFAIFEDGESRPANVQAGVGTLTDNAEAFTVRTGLLPAVFAFNVKTPITNGLRGSARVGFFPQIQNAGTKNQFGSQIDLRQAFFKVESDWGEFLGGRELSLFLARNLLTDMSLYGVGVQGAVSSGGTTLGRIGYGYVYPQFNAQFRYTTPDYGGFKASAAIFEPSQICSNIGGLCATKTNAPRFEGELSYVTPLGGGNLEIWMNGMWQDAKFETGPSGTVTAWGFGGGAQLTFGPAALMFSGYTGQALGTTLMLDTDSLDGTGQERDNDGYIVQGTYNILPSTKIGVSYGASTADETAADRAGRLAGTNPAQIKNQNSITAGIYYDLNKWFKLVGEYTHAKNEWFSSPDQSANIFTVGTFFTW